jgi:hypothetical protein
MRRLVVGLRHTSDLLLSRTRALCRCVWWGVDGDTVERNGQVWLVRRVRRSRAGGPESMILGDAE